MKTNFTTKIVIPLFVFLSILMAGGLFSCQKENPVLDKAETLMESQPDSSLLILRSMDKSQLSSKSEEARHALMMSMALDKNYIDTTTFEVLQPALDYYIENGTPDEKLRTYYYQGRIFQNQGDYDKALSSFTRGIDISSECRDSLTLARTFVAQACCYYEFYDFESYMLCHLKAAPIYRNKHLRWNEFDCLLNAINGAIITDNKNMADSLLKMCDNVGNVDPTQLIDLNRYKLSYSIKFEDKRKIEELITLNENSGELDNNSKLSIAYAYHKIGKSEKANQLLDEFHCLDEYESLKYQSILELVLEASGKDKEALEVYKKFAHAMDSIYALRFEQKAKSIEEKHNIELQAQENNLNKSKIIWLCIGGMVLLLLGIGVLILLVRSNKNKKNSAIKDALVVELKNKELRTEKELAYQKARTAELENEKLKSEKEKLSLQNKNLQLEKDKKALEAENLSHRVESLENEIGTLKDLLETQDEIPSEVQESIQIRIEMLNSLLAGRITNNLKYEQPYEAWVKEVTEDTDEFMNSNRMAFQISHPRFIKYFEEHGLTIDEINYVCLYAIGLIGKEVGNYMKKGGHVNKSSIIRKKLGLDRHGTNLGIYVRYLLKNL